MNCKALKPLLLLLFGGLTCPLLAQTLTQSELPIVLIETNGQAIPNEPKITADLKIIHHANGGINGINDAPNAYDGKIGIEIRGASSAYMPQRPFAIETRDALGNERKIEIFGMPSESDWCLIPHYNEKTLARNPLSYQLFREMGHYAPRTQLVEVVLNGSYEGIYLFCERIKRDKNRVNIEKSDPVANAGDSLSGGFIFKIDYWNAVDHFTSAFSPQGSNGAVIHYVFHYPKAEDLRLEQRNYLKNYVHSAETALFGAAFADTSLGYRRYFDTESFVDYFLLNELSRNNDGSKKSRYFYKDRNSVDSLIQAGPVWDFDWAWKDIPECAQYGATDGSGWSYRINDCYPDIYSPDLYPRMLQDSLFAKAVCARYAALRQTIFAKDYLDHYIDSIALLVNAAQVRHYQRWNILGYQNWTVEAGGYPSTYQGEVNKLKAWIGRRLDWLDLHIPQLCTFAEPPPPLLSASLEVFPNPTNGRCFWNSYVPYSGLLLCADVLGRVVELPTQRIGGRASFDLTDFSPGIYFVWAEGSKKDAVRVVKY